MDERRINIDPSLMIEFVDESSDALESLDNLFIQLEQNPQDEQIVQAIFRPVHSIKGNSGFFGLTTIKRLAHEAETLLDLVRKKLIPVTPNVISALLAALDALKSMFVRVREGQEECEDQSVIDGLIKNLKAPATPNRHDAEWTAVFGRLETLSKGIDPKLDDMLHVIDELRGFLNAIHDPSSGATPGGAEAGVVAHSEDVTSAIAAIRAILAEPVINLLPENQSAEVGAGISRIVESTTNEAAKAVARDLHENFEIFTTTVGFDDLLRQIVLEKLDQIEKGGTGPTAAPSPAATPESGSEAKGDAAAKPAATAAGDKADAHKTMRVAESCIDTFLEHVGELLVVGDMFANLQQRLVSAGVRREIIQTFKRTNETFATLSQNLQKSIMSIRKVTIRSIFQKVPRLVRDVASANDKQIDVQLIGDDVQVDKSLLDLFDAPLTHMVRNAADHGLEKPDVRTAAGKPAVGKIVVKMEESANHMVLSVSDDGAGLNLEAIRAKGEKLGMISSGQALTQAQLVNLIFASGLSTAEKVTDVSGRGVGLDVVKRAIESAGGAIDIQTRAGEGSSFTIRVPKSVTTQIMQGYLVRVGKQRYVLPMNKVRETACVDKGDIKTVIGEGRCVVRHGQVLPVIALRDVLGLSKAKDTDKVIIVTIQANRQDLSMAVDEVVGVQQLVLREIEGVEMQSDLITGGALMGDGTVALVVDVDAMDRWMRKAA
ncbi:MAG: chemotaxis protein CheA [Phycisphaeraceae bacterium]|nr:chemotaxis protein CheA [Phycisphaeraceae bacterium]